MPHRGKSTAKQHMGRSFGYHDLAKTAKSIFIFLFFSFLFFIDECMGEK